MLSGANSYGGGTTVTGGTLVVAANGALPDGNVTISGGKLQLAANTGFGADDVAGDQRRRSAGFDEQSCDPDLHGKFADHDDRKRNRFGLQRRRVERSGNHFQFGAGESAVWVGYADAADPGNPAGLAAGQIEVMYALLGDANLDGKVNGTDFVIMATNFNQSGMSWDQGDFNYDGNVNGSDFVLLADNFNQYASESSVAATDLAALESFAGANGISVNVPEPGVAGVLLVIGLTGIRKRRKRF